MSRLTDLALEQVLHVDFSPRKGLPERAPEDEHTHFFVTETRFGAKGAQKISGPTRPRTPALVSSALRASPRASRALALRAPPPMY